MLAYPAGVGEDSVLELHLTNNLESWILVTVEVRNENARRLGEGYVRNGRDEVKTSRSRVILLGFTKWIFLSVRAILIGNRRRDWSLCKGAQCHRARCWIDVH